MEIVCTQCGAKLPIEEDADFIRCSFCETALYVDADQTVKHYQLSVQAKAGELELLIKRRLSYLEIQEPVQVVSSKLVYFPFWRLALATGHSMVIPAANPPCEEIYSMTMPAGDLKLFQPEAVEGQELVEPEIMIEDARAEAELMLDNPNAEFESTSLVHLPLYEVDYRCQDQDFACLVSAVSGEVFADEWPAAPQKEKDRILGMIAIAALALFFIEAALIPGFWLALLAFAVTGTGIYFAARKLLQNMGW